MSNHNMNEGGNEVPDKEKQVIDNILKLYDLNAESYIKVRSAYKIKTSIGSICLKKLKHGKFKAENGNELVNQLYNNNFIKTPKYFKTKNGKLFVKYKKLFFYVTEWIDGEECKLNSIEEVINCTKLLGEFHLATTNIQTKKLKVKNNLRNWPKIFKEMINDFYKFEKAIDNKKIKSTFDEKYKENISIFESRAMLSLKILNESNYYKLSEEASKNHTLCHDSFYYQNIIKKDNVYYIIDLDSIMVDLHVNDLGKYIRRLMSKSDFMWDFKYARSIIESYNSVISLTKNELEVMLALIIFPHKFWKLGKKRYKKYKNWSDQKYSHKLSKILKEDAFQEVFIEEYLKYLIEKN